MDERCGGANYSDAQEQFEFDFKDLLGLGRRRKTVMSRYEL